MKFQTTVHTGKHSDTVTAAGWCGPELFTAADDHNILRWREGAQDVSTFNTVAADWYPTTMHWMPTNKKGLPDAFAIGSADGKFRIISRAGRIEKVVEAHRGAVTKLQWSNDGSALVTAGEDGLVKIWSKAGMLRTTLAQIGTPVYSLAWGPDAGCVLFTGGKTLTIKPLQPTAKTEEWKAHEGLILAVDWNPLNGLIVSGGEDCRYKVWDAFGRLVYASGLHEFPVSSLQWCPDGSVFAVGGFNTLRLCDRAGWSHALEKPDGAGSVYQLAWSDDGTQVAGACASGQVVVATVLERRVAWGGYEAVLVGEKSVAVRSVVQKTDELLDFRDRVVRMSLGHDHLVVATTTQGYVYTTRNWNTPTTFDLKEGTITMIQQSPKHVLLCDSNSGLHVFQYDGRAVSSPLRVPNLRPEHTNELTVSIASDAVAIIDSRDAKTVHVLDVASGKPLGKPVVHNVEVAEVALDQSSASSSSAGVGGARLLALVDRNRDVFLTATRAATSAHVMHKLGTMANSIAWHTSASMLAAVSDGKLTVWMHPAAVHVDAGLLSKTRVEHAAPELGKSPQLVGFDSAVCSVRRADGAEIALSVSPYPRLLHEYVAQQRWPDAVRLCRLVKDEALWSCLAALAAAHRELNTAEIAYAAVDAVDKVEFIQGVKSLPTPEARSAEMLLFCRRADEAEAMLLQAGLVYRAIDLNCRLFRWTRALELAMKHKTHIDTVVSRRQLYLKSFGRTETLDQFVELARSVDLDPEKIKLKIDQELEAERSRPGAKPYA